MDVDLQLSGCERLPSVVIKDTNESALGLQWLDLELTSLARDMIRALGDSQGPKYAAISIDAIISDFFDSSVHVPSHASAYLEWLHEHVGSLVVARELLIGAFPPWTHEALRQGSKNHRSRGLLKSLGVSIIPLVVKSDFWDRVVNDQLLHTREGMPKPPPTVLKANACVSVLLLDLVRTFCNILNPDDVGGNLSALLLPLFEVASQSNFGLVRETSMRTLTTIAVSLGKKGVEDLAVQEQHRLVASMVGRLRLHAGRLKHGNDATKDVLAIANALNLMLEYVIKVPLDWNDNRSTTNRGSVGDLMALLQHRLDQLMYDKDLSEASLEVLCSLHMRFFDYFIYIFRVEKTATYSHKTRDVEEQNNWLDQLYKFRERSSVVPIHEEYRENAKNEGDRMLRYLDVSANEIELLSILIARNCTLLSNQSLSIRVSACQVLTSAFQFLAFVGTVHEVETQNSSLVPVKKSVCLPILAEHVFSNCRI
jgi:hypothetical protein